MGQRTSPYIIIAHRANLKGPNSDTENSLESIQDCFAFGFDVEIDVWHRDGLFWLGHDRPSFHITDIHVERILKNEKTWCHAKNLSAAIKLQEIGAHWFWHQNDDFTLTSKGFFWTYPGKPCGQKSISVLPELDCHANTFHLAAGLCTDFPWRYIDVNNRI